MHSLTRRSRSIVVLVLVAVLTGPSLLSAQSAPPFLSPRILAIYQADGTLQCQAGVGSSLIAAASELARKGATVLTMERRKLPLAVPAECGTATGMVNFFEVVVDDNSTLDLRPGAAAAFALWQYEESTLIVSIRDGATACNPVGRTLDASAKVLVAAGVVPLEQYVMKNPTSNSKFCTIPTGDTHIFRIRSVDLVAAKKLKFAENASRTAEACREVHAPVLGSPEADRLGSPETFSLIIPNRDVVPKQLRGKTVLVSFLLSNRGLVDSVWFDPTPPVGSDAKLVKSMKGYSWRPAVMDGCYVAVTATITIVVP